MRLSPAEFIIHRFGGVRKTARILNKTPSTISKWQHLGLIPAKNQKPILDKAQELDLDITPDDLVNGRNIRVSELQND